MNNLLVVVLLLILVIYILYFTITQYKKSKYLKAGKKWDGIVKELRSRK